MDLIDANQSCYNKDVKNIGQRLEQKLVSNRAPVETSDKIDSKSITGDEMTLSLHRQQNGYLQKETESCKIVEDIWNSFNAFQRTIADVYEKAKLINNASYDHTSVRVRSLNSHTFPINTTSKPISSMSETSTSCSSLTVSKTACSLTTTLCNLAFQTKLNSGISASKTSTSSSLSTLSSSNPGVSVFKTDCRNLLESNNSSPSTKSSNSILKCTRDKVSSVTNTVGTPRNLNQDVKASGIISNQSLPTTDPSPCGTTISPKFENFSNLKLEKRRILREFFSEDDDWDIYQPGMNTTESIPSTESSLESNFILRRKTENCSSKNNLISVIDYDTYQRTSPYIPPATGRSPSSSSVNKGSTFSECNKDRMLKEVKAYFLENPIHVTGNISDRERNKWIINAPYFSKSFALTHGLILPNTTSIQEPKLLEELKKENEQIQVQGLANDLYENYLRVRLINDQLKEQLINIRGRFLSQNRDDGTTSRVKSEGVLVSQTYASNSSCPRTANQAHVIKPLGLNPSNYNSHNADYKVKTFPRFLKTCDALTSIKSNDILETGSNRRSFLLQSSNKDNKESLDTSKMFPHIQNSTDPNDKKNSSEVHSRTSSNLKNKVSNSNPFILSSDQHVKEN